jgi:hypothetical protein
MSTCCHGAGGCCHGSARRALPSKCCQERLIQATATFQLRTHRDSRAGWGTCVYRLISGLTDTVLGSPECVAMNLRNTRFGPAERLAKNRPMRALPFLILMVLVFPCTGATAGTLRCGSYLIQVGDDAFSVLAKCGEPTQRTTIAEPLYASSDGGGTYPTGLVGYRQVWRYDRGPMSFPVIIKIDDGVVQSIHFVR